MTNRAWLAPLLLSLATAGCAADDGAPGPISFEEFRDQAYQESDTGIWVVNGDEPAMTEDDLRAVYERYEAGFAVESELASADRPLIVNTVGGADDRWSDTEKRNLTFCIDKRGFGNRYAAVVTAMAEATAAWEGVANVDFVYASANDAKCNARTATVFNVRQVCQGQYLARAFFPSTQRRGREVLIDCTSFGNIAPYTLTGILRHELGHTIGLRHEHTRPEAGTCFENTSWRALTNYDANSVMHYPQCNGANTNGDLDLTALDQAGAGALYPF